MGMTITEKILAKSAGLDKVVPGQIIDASIDAASTNEKQGPLFYKKFREMGLKIWDSERAIVFVDHGVPASKVNDANQIVESVKFAEDYGIKLYYAEGIEHQIMPERGHIVPGKVYVCTDSHTTTYGGLGAFSTGNGATEMAWIFAKGKIWLKVPKTILIRINGKLNPYVSGKDIALYVMKVLGPDGAQYMAIEYTGSAIHELSVEARLTLCNMAVEAGAKNGIIAPDEKTVEYLKDRVSEPWEMIDSDPDAEYERIIDIDAKDIAPMVALPGGSHFSVPVTEIEGTPFRRALLGTCTNGRMEDFRIADKIIKGKKIAPGVVLQVIPGSVDILKQCLKEGIVDDFVNAGAIWCNPQCGPCAGGHYGLLGAGEVCLSTSNRNMKGRMGDATSQVYLTSPAVVAASVLNGVITDPNKV